MANEIQKMREAVNVRMFRKIAQNIRRLVDHIRKEKSLPENLAREAFDQIDDLAIEALIAPPRNCDVGTADEQSERFDKFCDEQCMKSCKSCPVYKEMTTDIECFAKWAQMPYEEEREGEGDGR